MKSRSYVAVFTLLRSSVPTISQMPSEIKAWQTELPCSSLSCLSSSPRASPSLFEPKIRQSDSRLECQIKSTFHPRENGPRFNNYGIKVYLPFNYLLQKPKKLSLWY
jgi:hypothetical protein